MRMGMAGNAVDCVEIVGIFKLISDIWWDLRGLASRLM